MGTQPGSEGFLIDLAFTDTFEDFDVRRSNELLQFNTSPDR
jgi:hypothetical protein